LAKLLFIEFTGIGDAEDHFLLTGVRPHTGLVYPR
jgi:hypothetical protein